MVINWGFNSKVSFRIHQWCRQWENWEHSSSFTSLFSSSAVPPLAHQMPNIMRQLRVTFCLFPWFVIDALANSHKLPLKLKADSFFFFFFETPRFFFKFNTLYTYCTVLCSATPAPTYSGKSQTATGYTFLGNYCPNQGNLVFWWDFQLTQVCVVWLIRPLLSKTVGLCKAVFLADSVSWVQTPLYLYFLPCNLLLIRDFQCLW